MRNMGIYKKIQLTVLLILAISCIAMVFVDPSLYHFVFTNKHILKVCIMAWIILLITFLFLFLDFTFLSSLKHDYNSLNEAAYSDYITGISNRFSCDMYLEQYNDVDLPLNIACVMIDLVNIDRINKMYGHAQGNELLKQFSDILSTAAVSLCFVGRNGGNKFLAVLEECDPKKLQFFLNRLEEKISQHNMSREGHTIEYRVGTAYNETEQLKQITELISLANNRIEES